MSEAIVRRHPVDYESLTKGDVIITEVIERFSGIKRENIKKYQIVLMQLREQVERELEAIGKHVLVKIEKDYLRILTDEEAVDYVDDRHTSLRRQMFKNHGRSISSIDPSLLSDGQKAEHERGIINRSKELQAIRDARKLLSQPHQRQSPGLPE